MRCAGCRRAGDRQDRRCVSSFKNHTLVPFCAKHEVDTRICVRRLTRTRSGPLGTLYSTNRPHGTQSQSVSEPSSRGTTPSPRAHVRCVAARAPGPTEHALGPEGGHTHGRRRRTARVVLSSARQGRAAHPGAATTAVGPTSLGACGHTSGIRHLLLWGSGFWFSSRFRSVGVA